MAVYGERQGEDPMIRIVAGWIWTLSGIVWTRGRDYRREGGRIQATDLQRQWKSTASVMMRRDWREGENRQTDRQTKRVGGIHEQRLL